MVFKVRVLTHVTRFMEMGLYLVNFIEVFVDFLLQV